MTHLDTMKLALEALECGFMGPNIVKYNQAITAIKEALAQSEQQNNEHFKPMETDWNAVHEKLELVWYRELSADEGLDEIQDLIDTTPQQRKPLTDEERFQLRCQWNPEIHGAMHDYIIQQTEAAHGIKE